MTSPLEVEEVGDDGRMIDISGKMVSLVNVKSEVMGGHVQLTACGGVSGSATGLVGEWQRGCEREQWYVRV